MRILIVGLGSIGNRHARILKEHFHHELFSFRSKQDGPKNTLWIHEVYTWEEAAEMKADVALITNPTHQHIETALACAKRGMHLFIEKPLSHTMDGVSDLLRLCREKNLTCYTAYCMRFHPVIKELKSRVAGKRVLHVRTAVSSYLPYWRPGTDHRKSYSANTAHGGGVLLDLSHEFDYLQYLFGSIKEMNGWCGRVSDVALDAEDVADVVIKTVGGTPINLHMNFMSRFEERNVIVDFDGGYIVGDILHNRVEWGDGDTKEEKIFTTNRDDYLQEQLEYFFANIGNAKIMNNLEESSNLLQNILQFKHRQHQI